MPANTPLLASTALYRIGAVSKATGVPVSTLRIWETRYGAFSPVKTQGNQRLYTEQDVAKALLLKQLSQSGHGMGSIAPLDVNQLRRMTQAFQPSASPAPAGVGQSGQTVQLAVIGMGMANRIESNQFAAALTDITLQLADVFTDLEAAANAAWSGHPHVLLIKVNTLQTSVHAAIQALLAQHPCKRVIVVYNFAPEAVVKAMTFSGLILRREPLSDVELAALLKSVWGAHALLQPWLGAHAATIPPRKYADATLSRVARISTNVLCECPRHVAELIAQLASFEQYSQECLDRNEQDAHLHTYLRGVSGAARAMFESALEKIALHEGIDLKEVPR